MQVDRYFASDASECRTRVSSEIHRRVRQDSTNKSRDYEFYVLFGSRTSLTLTLSGSLKLIY